ncbi:hypothetical protein BDW62DRAFT_186318 [Aspergillus aurantiobrunneus]
MPSAFMRFPVRDRMLPPRWECLFLSTVVGIGIKENDIRPVTERGGYAALAWSTVSGECASTFCCLESILCQREHVRRGKPRDHSDTSTRRALPQYLLRRTCSWGESSYAQAGRYLLIFAAGGRKYIFTGLLGASPDKVNPTASTGDCEPLLSLPGPASPLEHVIRHHAARSARLLLPALSENH